MLFSIITPTYNRADKIGIAIQSVLDQNYHDFEMIIIDDGSTDNTKDVVEKFDDPRIFYFKKENEERNIARNYGISKASGDYINFLDSDDILLNHHLETGYSFILENHYPEIIHLGYTYIKNSHDPLNNSQSFTVGNKELIQQNFLSCNSIFIKKEIINKYQFLNSTNAILGEDHYLWLKLSARYKIHLSHQVTSAIVEHETRSLNVIDIDKLEKGMTEINHGLMKDDVFLEYYGWRAKKYFANNHLFVAHQLILAKRKKKALNYIYKSTTSYFPIIFSRKFISPLIRLLIT